jgi:predicted ABC-type transport system involved in lysophospholipase L1 biosynthesis ATPase subunit
MSWGGSGPAGGKANDAAGALAAERRHRVPQRDVPLQGRRVPAISGLDLRLPETGMCALIGRNGSGKSTMLRLIQGFLREYEGELLAGGADVRSYHPRWLRSHMAVVNQDTILFAGTVRQNVTCWTAGVTDDDIRKALHLSGAWEFVEALPEKLDARLTENGANLSGGSASGCRWRGRCCAIRARCWTSRPRFDAEAAGAGDAADGLGRAADGAGVPSFGGNYAADTIILLDEGKVAAQGGMRSCWRRRRCISRCGGIICGRAGGVLAW